MSQGPSSDIAFTPAVKALQAERGSRAAYARMEARGGFRTALTPDLLAFLGDVDTAFLATANASGQPYAQHRGGPKGFIRPVDETTLGFLDYRGNRQYITSGNLVENDKAFLFLIDFAHRRRVKLWGRAWTDRSPAVLAALGSEDKTAEPEQAILFAVRAWDINCPQHIHEKFDAADVQAAIGPLRAERDRLLAERDRLLAENAALRDRLAEAAHAGEGRAAARDGRGGSSIPVDDVVPPGRT